MEPELELKPIYQCGECDTIFQIFSTVELGGLVHNLCPNPGCHGPAELCPPIPSEAVSIYFMHLVAHSGFDYHRRMNLREISESQMGPWDPDYRRR